MGVLDWIVLISTLFIIIIYGVWKTKGRNTSEDFLIGKRENKWWTIGLSIMATQASAITFISTPGQAYEDGMRFVQFYFGLPLAMVFLSIFFLPRFYHLKVYTAYEFLESRFDVRMRTLTAIIFMLQRGLAAGITIYAPTIILSHLLGWDLNTTSIIIGCLVIFYTMLGGADAVSVTQQQQMIVMLAGMFLAGAIIILKLPNDITFKNSIDLAGYIGKLNMVDTKFDLSQKYNIWSAFLGGTFLFMSYFGTDQSQVQRYISGKTLRESRLGLLFNAIFKVPMQFMILSIGILVYIFYLFNPIPVHFNEVNVNAIKQDSAYSNKFYTIENQFNRAHDEKRESVLKLNEAIKSDDEQQIRMLVSDVKKLEFQENKYRTEVDQLIKQQNSQHETEDSDYVFITFILSYMPKGLIGFMLAAIFCAAMSTTSSEINALSTASMMDVFKRHIIKNESDAYYLKMSKIFTFGWGVLIIIISLVASLFDNLIEAVNIAGSLFYGSMLGIFLVAFFLKRIQGQAVFYAAILAQSIVILLFYLNKIGTIHLSYLWYNLFGCAVVIIASSLFQGMNSKIIDRK
ncbi:MAG: sodium:solute symporter [Saprospiraceae bacterium]|nr:sodium:solute symporter [Saprospiraceae bacterium]